MGITGGELVVLALKKNNVNKIFGLVGNHLSPIFVYTKRHKLQIIDVRHEQAAICMADAYSQVTRKPGVAMVVGGPGFTNSITGIVKAYMANTPMLVIIGGSVPQQKDMGGLQDLNQIDMIKEYSKWSAVVYDTKRIPEYIKRGLEESISGRMGPVVLEIPINILKNQVNENKVFWPTTMKSRFTDSCLNPELLNKIIETILEAKKPIILAGDEVYYSYAEKSLINFVEKMGIPVYTVNKARGCLPEEHELCFGNGRVLEAGPQLYGLKNADCVINIGLYIDYQMNYCKPPIFGNNQYFININRDTTSNSVYNKQQSISIVTNLSRALDILSENINSIGRPNFKEWVEELREREKLYWKNLKNSIAIGGSKIHPLNLIENIIANIEDDSIFVVDGSNAMFWGSLLFKCNYPGQIIIGPDGTFGPMGCGIPLALGAKLANPDRDVILYTGDGSFGFNAIEINTALRLDIPITIVVHNDMSWGFCKNTQVVLYGKENTAGTELGLTRYDKIVESMGGIGFFVDKADKMVPAVKKVLSSNKLSCLNVLVDKDAYAPGAVRFNESLTAMK